MSKRYSSDFKKLVRKILRVNKGNVVGTAQFVDIPERTLRDWQREWQRAAARPAATAAAQPPLPQRRDLP